MTASSGTETVQVFVAAGSNIDPCANLLRALDVLARAREGTTVQEALDGIPIEDAAVAEAICALLTDGVLRGGA